MPLAEGNSQNLPSTKTLEKVKVPSTKSLVFSLKLMSPSPASPQEQEPAPLTIRTPYSVQRVPLKENAKEELAPYKHSWCQGWLQEPLPSSLVQLTHPTATQGDAGPNLPWVFQLIWHCKFLASAICLYALLGTTVLQMDENLHMLLLCSKHKAAVADTHIYLY